MYMNLAKILKYIYLLRTNMELLLCWFWKWETETICDLLTGLFVEQSLSRLSPICYCVTVGTTHSKVQQTSDPLSSSTYTAMTIRVMFSRPGVVQALAWPFKSFWEGAFSLRCKRLDLCLLCHNMFTTVKLRLNLWSVSLLQSYSVAGIGLQIVYFMTRFQALGKSSRHCGIMQKFHIASWVSWLQWSAIMLSVIPQLWNSLCQRFPYFKLWFM